MTAFQSEDLSFLHRFVQSPDETCSAHAASIALRVVQIAAEPPGVAPSAVSAARLALAQLLAAPCLDAVPQLLAICQRSVASQLLDVFVLSSAAWKALVAVCLHPHLVVHFALRLRILTCALRSAIVMLLRAVPPQHNPPSDSQLTHIHRCLKIAKFYCINAAKCANVLTSSHNKQTIPSKPIDSNPLPHLLSHVLYLTALVSHLLLFDHTLSVTSVTAIRQHLAPLIATSLNSTLSLIHHPSPLNSHPTIKLLFQTALQNFSNPHYFPSDPDHHVSLPALLLLAILHLMRHIIPHSQTNPSHHHTPQCLAFATTLLPHLFLSATNVYTQLVSLRTTQTRHHFLHLVTSAAAQCISLAHNHLSHTQAHQHITNNLLHQLTEPSPIRAHIAKHAIIALHQNPSSHLRNQDNILAHVLACARISHSLHSSQFHTRWIPLAAELVSCRLRQSASDLCISHILDHSFNLIATQTNKIPPRTNDPVLMLLIASILNTPHPDNPASQSDHFSLKQLIKVLSPPSEKDPTDALAQLVSNFSSKPAAPGSQLLKCHVAIASHLLDRSALCEAALAFMQCNADGEQTCIALNSCHPSYMTSKHIAAVCKAANASIQMHGIATCPAVAAFVARSAAALHESVSVADWQILVQALDVAISTSKKEASFGDMKACVTFSLVLHHTATALLNIASLPDSSKQRQTRITLPPNILKEAEDALEIVQQASKVSFGVGSEMDLRRDREGIAAEIKSLAEIDECSKNDASGAEIRERIATARHILSQALGDLFRSKPNGKTATEINEELQTMHSVLTAASHCFADEHSRSK